VFESEVQWQRLFGNFNHAASVI